MFVQVIQGRAADAAGLRKQMERWDQDIKAGAEGFLGSTAGVAEDGTFIAAARFESEEAARRNSERPEQGQWWEETSKYIEGDATFYDCRDVDVFGGGGSDDAGFVQVIQAYTDDPARLRAGAAQAMNDPSMSEHRPDVIGGFTAWGPDNGFSDFIFFTSEAAAREGEKKEMPAEMKKGFEEYQSLLRDVKYIDLKEPWFSSK